MAKISLIVNGNPVNANVDPRTLLVQFLRENLRLTGTHVGCDTSQCGACVVHLDGKAVKSCTTLAVMADGHEVKTIEGLGVRCMGVTGNIGDREAVAPRPASRIRLPAHGDDHPPGPLDDSFTLVGESAAGPNDQHDAELALEFGDVS